MGMTEKSKSIDRREFLKWLGVIATSGAVGATLGYFATPSKIVEVEKPPPSLKIPETPVKIGFQTYYTGAPSILAEPIAKGVKLAVEEINAEGGFLGKRPIQLLEKDEGTVDDTKKGYIKLVEEDKIDYYLGLISSSNTSAIAPIAEDLGVLTIFIGGCTNNVFEEIDKNPHFVFRIMPPDSVSHVGLAIMTVLTWPNIKKIAHLHPDYSFGHDAYMYINAVLEKLLPDFEIVYEGWPPFQATDFSSHISSIIAAKPDVLFTVVWGNDFTLFYKQALGYGLFNQIKVASGYSHGITPNKGPEKDYPEGCIAGFHGTYYFTNPPIESWPLNKQFVTNYHNKFGEYPNYGAESGYAGMYALKLAIEKAAKITGGWPDVDKVIECLEGLQWLTPSGCRYIRPEDHQAYKNAVYGISSNVPEYNFSVATNITYIPVEKIMQPPGIKAIDWIKNTWPKLY